MIRFRRLVQIFCLVLFSGLLTLVSISGISMSYPDFFLQLDPVLVFITAISARIILLSFIPAVIVMLSGPFIGRVFCGYICPMGTTLDWTDALFDLKNKSCLFLRNQSEIKNLLNVKYWCLSFYWDQHCLASHLSFLPPPCLWLPGFNGLVIFPVISFLSKEGLDLVRPLGDMLDINFISFAQVRTIRL